MRSTYVAGALVSFLGPLATGGPTDTDESGMIKLMVVGDSLSHGFEGDHTWRYRLWEWLRDQEINATFVGRHTGTFPQVEGQGPICQNKTLLKQISDASFRYPVQDAGYAEDITHDWPNAHSSMYGRQASRLNLKNMTADFDPDYIIIQLGINDLIHNLSPHTVRAHLGRLVDEARAVKSDVRFVIATMPGIKTLLGIPFSFDDRSEKLSEMIEHAIREWDIAESPVALVRLRATYDCDPDRCPVGWDGRNPAELGEYQIASAFSQTLHERFGFGRVPLKVPAEAVVSERRVSTPKNFMIERVPWGLKLTWDKVSSAYRYDVAARKANTTEWQMVLSGNGYEYGARRYDVLDVETGEEWEFKVRANNGEVNGTERFSDWTPIKSETTNITTDMCKQGLRPNGVNRTHRHQVDRPPFLSYVALFICVATIYELGRRYLLHPWRATSSAYMPIR
ncbi:SGNH hydrolase-type esterase domain-containing protein [Truncatella angustata]|uniref:SGNH hydrolase-type esterase domain-containing protein n=1 Tax=Truncatella angustata TaxID=152316 RepID=A0A9P8RPK9_9PEZI|nr:SGNH hydrolase-type esterase domain-containing protein [Truncatella angustata]KAH6647342.1 SGNH hydrolase-type esterase domain-containing protein [Truncatella angustata]KAH8203176.1 hypothetical protein TruAng_002697 [Truncatella angustata]